MAQAWYRFDLDKTYLATPFEHRLQMIKTPFEAPEAKRTLPGMAALVRGLVAHPGQRAKTADLTILSASPTFMEEKLRAKLTLDGVPVVRLVLKDQWGLIRRGRLREIVNPFAYKLAALLRLGADVEDPDFEVLVGDDWDLDPLIYTTYAELRSGRLPESVFERMRRGFPSSAEVEKLLPVLAAPLYERPSVHRIYIRREKKRGPEFYRAFGSRIRVYDDAFQLALLLFDTGCLGETGVRDVIRELQDRRWRSAAFHWSWQSIIHEHHFRRFDEIVHLLGEIDLLPRRGILDRVLQRPPEPAPSDSPPNWTAILERLLPST